MLFVLAFWFFSFALRPHSRTHPHALLYFIFLRNFLSCHSLILRCYYSRRSFVDVEFILILFRFVLILFQQFGRLEPILRFFIASDFLLRSFRTYIFSHFQSSNIRTLTTPYVYLHAVGCGHIIQPKRVHLKCA